MIDILGIFAIKGTNVFWIYFLLALFIAIIGCAFLRCIPNVKVTPCAHVNACNYPEITHSISPH